MKALAIVTIVISIFGLGACFGVYCEYVTLKNELDQATSGGRVVVYRDHIYSITEIKTPSLRKTGH